MGDCFPQRSTVGTVGQQHADERVVAVLVFCRRGGLRGDVAVGGGGAELVDEEEHRFGQGRERLRRDPGAQRGGGHVLPGDPAPTC